MGGRNPGDLEDRIAFAGKRALGRVALLGLEGFGDDLRPVGHTGDDALPAQWRSGYHLQVVRSGRLLQTVLKRLGGQRLRVVCLGWVSFWRISVVCMVGRTSASDWACAVWRSST